MEEWRAALWTQALADQGIADAPGGAALQARFREARLHHFRFEPGAKVQCACGAILKLPFDTLQPALCLSRSDLVQKVFAFSLARVRLSVEHWRVLTVQHPRLLVQPQSLCYPGRKGSPTHTHTHRYIHACANYVYSLDLVVVREQCRGSTQHVGNSLTAVCFRACAGAGHILTRERIGHCHHYERPP